MNFMKWNPANPTPDGALETYDIAIRERAKLPESVKSASVRLSLADEWMLSVSVQVTGMEKAWTLSRAIGMFPDSDEAKLQAGAIALNAVGTFAEDFDAAAEAMNAIETWDGDNDARKAVIDRDSMMSPAYYFRILNRIGLTVSCDDSIPEKYAAAVTYGTENGPDTGFRFAVDAGDIDKAKDAAAKAAAVCLENIGNDIRILYELLEGVAESKNDMSEKLPRLLSA